MPDSDDNLLRILAPDDLRLWRFIQRQVTPLHGALEEDSADESMPVKAATPPPPQQPHKKKPPPDLPQLEQGNFSGVEGATANRLKRGKMRIERRLDLHGFNRLEAYDRLEQFLIGAQSQGKRLVLVITGKGQRNIPSETGILRSQMPIWLNEPPLRRLILAYDTARREDGEHGAFYILLKKKPI